MFLKKHRREAVLLLLQLFMFYIFPLFAGPTDAMGMVFLILLASLILGFLCGCLSKTKLKYLYPAAAAILFLPSVWIYYNSSALIHALWHFTAASAGMALGSLLQISFRRK